MKYVFTLIGIIFSLNIFAQSLEDNISVIYMKADVLMQSERYDEAIRVYNQIIREQPAFKLALFQRAKAKYALGAYKGSRKDLLQHIDLKGISKNVVHLMGQSEFELRNYPQAKSYFDVALEMDKFDAKLYFHRALVHLAMEDQNGACEDWSQAAQLGSKLARSKMADNCLHWEKPTHQEPSVESPQNTDQDMEETEDGPITQIPDYPGKQGDTRTDQPAEDLDSSQEFEIDESLTLVVGNGLGKRKIESVPDIFLLSENSGRVVINVCVNESGQVSDATFNRDLSTLFKTNLNSLAIRKSKELVFLPSFRSEQCGTVTFLIKA
jgi:tetratricopeptide (TPR) repeat protein